MWSCDPGSRGTSGASPISPNSEEPFLPLLWNHTDHLWLSTIIARFYDSILNSRTQKVGKKHKHTHMLTHTCRHTELISFLTCHSVWSVSLWPQFIEEPLKFSPYQVQGTFFIFSDCAVRRGGGMNLHGNIENDAKWVRFLKSALKTDLETIRINCKIWPPLQILLLSAFFWLFLQTAKILRNKWRKLWL